jgi:hypothetical protein
MSLFQKKPKESNKNSEDESLEANAKWLREFLQNKSASNEINAGERKELKQRFFNKKGRPKWNLLLKVVNWIELESLQQAMKLDLPVTPYLVDLLEVGVANYLMRIAVEQKEEQMRRSLSTDEKIKIMEGLRQEQINSAKSLKSYFDEFERTKISPLGWRLAVKADGTSKYWIQPKNKKFPQLWQSMWELDPSDVNKISQALMEGKTVDEIGKLIKRELSNKRE